MYFGEYEHCLDTKGRIFVPAKLRDALGEKFMITIGLDNCLFVFDMDTFELYREKISAISIANPDVRKFARFFFAGAAECEPDKQGRIVIPQKLRTYAHLEKEVTIVGSSNRVEIWDRNAWCDEYGIEKFSPEEYSDKLQLMGL